MEVELKYGFCSERTFQQMLEATALGAFRLEESQVLQVHDRYLDTPDRALLRAGYACRIRREYDCSQDREDDCPEGQEQDGTPRSQSGRYVATVKGLGDAKGAYHRRVEHEVDLPGPLPPGEWPPGPARDLVLSLCGPCGLLPLFSIEQERHRRRLYDGERAVAEVSLDRVQFYDGANEERSSSLEFEAELLPAGSREDLDRLEVELKGREGLVPRRESKFEQGLALLDRPAPGYGKPLPPKLDPDDAMSEAGRKILRYHFQVMVYHEPATRRGEDVEALHDMRVATRRMRAAWRVFGDHFDDEAVAPYLKGLKRTGQALGPVRDLDVLKEKTQAYADTLPEPQREGLDGLFAAIDRHRAAAREQMLGWLDSRRYALFKKRFGHFLDTEGLGSRSVAPGDGGPRPSRLRHVAPMAVYERLAAVRAYDEWVTVPHPPLARLHALRIACKRLRYTLEFFEQVLGPETRTAIRQVVAVQDHLGALQDAVVAGDILRQYLATGSWDEAVKAPEPRVSGTSPEVEASSPEVRAYLAARQAEAQRLVETFSQVWQQIVAAEFSERIAGIVAGL